MAFLVVYWIVHMLSDFAINHRHLISTIILIICLEVVQWAGQCTGIFDNVTAKELTLFCLHKMMQVHEGRNHEVRELVKNAGLQVSACSINDIISSPNSLSLSIKTYIVYALSSLNQKVMSYPLKTCFVIDSWGKKGKDKKAV